MQTCKMLSLFLASILLSILSVSASPMPVPGPGELSVEDYYNLVYKRTYPSFPETPKSCPICQKDYDSINSCAEAAPVLANFSQIIFNPGAFVDVIQCACTDTFQSAFPQCVDCFQQTNQSWALDTTVTDPNNVVDGMRKVCALASALLGNVSYTNGDATPTSSSAATTTANAAVTPLLQSYPGLVGFLTLFAIALGTSTLIVS